MIQGVAVSVCHVREWVGGEPGPGGIDGTSKISTANREVGRRETRGIADDEVPGCANQYAVAVKGDVVSINAVPTTGGTDSGVRAGQGTGPGALIPHDHRIADDLDAIETIATDHATTDEARRSSDQ